MGRVLFDFDRSGGWGGILRGGLRFGGMVLLIALVMQAGGRALAAPGDAASSPADTDGVVDPGQAEAEAAERPAFRPPVIPSSAVLREPDVSVDINELRAVSRAVFSADGSVLWLAGPAAVGGNGVEDLAAMAWRLGSPQRVVGFEPAVMSVTRVFPPLDPAFRWTVERLSAAEAGGVWAAGARWELQEGQAVAFGRNSSKKYIARWDPSGDADPEIWLADEPGYEEAERRLEELGASRLRLERGQDAQGKPAYWVTHLVARDTGRIVARFIDDTPAGPHGVFLLRRALTPDGRYFLLTYSDDRFGRTRYFSRYDRERDTWTWPRLIRLPQGQDVTVISRDGQRVASTAGVANVPNRVDLTFLRPDDRYDPELAERLAAAWQRPAEPEPRDEVAALEPARRVTLPEPPADFANAPGADRQLDLDLLATSVWSAQLTDDGRTLYVGYVPVQQPRREPGRWRSVSRLRAIDVETGATRWDVEPPEPEHVGGAFNSGFIGVNWPSVEVLAGGDPVLLQAVATRPAGPISAGGYYERAPRVDVYRLDARDGTITQTIRGEPSEMLRVRRLVPPEPDADDGLMALRHHLPMSRRWIHGRSASDYRWRLERWRDADLAPELLLSEDRAFFDSEPYTVWMPRIDTVRLSADGTHIEGVTRVTLRTPSLDTAEFYRNVPRARIQRYALPEGRAVAPTYRLPASENWGPTDAAAPSRPIYEPTSSPPRRLRVLTPVERADEGSGAAGGSGGDDATGGWTCLLAVEEGNWHNHGLGFRFRGGQLRADPGGSAVRWYTGHTATSALWLLRLDLLTGHTELRGVVEDQRAHRLHTDALRDGSRVVVLRLPPEVPGFPAAGGGRQGVKPDEVTQLLVYDFPPAGAPQTP